VYRIRTRDPGIGASTGKASGRDWSPAEGQTSLADAYEKVNAARALLRRGIDPRRAGITVALCVRAEKPSAPSPSGHSVGHLAHEFMTRHVKRQRPRPDGHRLAVALNLNGSFAGLVSCRLGFKFSSCRGNLGCVNWSP
jgi:hypothetical protein